MEQNAKVLDGIYVVLIQKQSTLIREGDLRLSGSRKKIIRGLLMTNNQSNCQHACRNTCAMLNEALRKETSLVMFYKSTLEECNMPEVKSFIDEIVEEKSKLIMQIIQKLNEIHVRSQIMDGVATSFNNIDG
jgi:hypothetical protein